MVGVCNVLQTVGDPLSLSLALDIMEEVLHSGGDPRKQGRRMARDGALAALVKPCPLRRLPAQVACLHTSLALSTYSGTHDFSCQMMLYCQASRTSRA